MKEIAEPQTSEMLKAKIKMETPVMRPAVLDAIAAFQDQSLSSIVRETVKSFNDVDIKYSGLVAIARLKDKDSLPLIQDLLKHENQKIVHTAIWTLIHIDTKESLDILKDISTEHKDEKLRTYTKEILNHPTYYPPQK